MSLDMAPEHLCSVHCNFGNTTLAVSVPYTSVSSGTVVRCGYCLNLLTVNMRPLLQTQTCHHLQKRRLWSFEEGREESVGSAGAGSSTAGGLSSKCNNFLALPHSPQHLHHPPTPPTPPAPEMRQRLPSAYNRFIKEEIPRIKATNPEISHRKAFSTAAKNF